MGIDAEPHYAVQITTVAHMEALSSSLFHLGNHSYQTWAVCNCALDFWLEEVWFVRDTYSWRKV